MTDYKTNFAERADHGITADKLGPAALNYGERVSVPLTRFEELTKKECLLHQIENALTMVEEYKLKNAIQLLLSVLPR